MRKIALVLAFLPSLALAQAQASVQFSLNLPTVLPQLVVVQPGIRVVPDVEEEVFYTNGWYYCRHDGGWYRSHDHRGGWVFVEPRRVPPGLARIPPGQYRRWHPRGGPEYRPAPTVFRPAPGPRGYPGPGPGYRPEGEGHGRGHGEGHGRGEGHGHEGHGRGEGRGHDKHGG